MLQKPREESVSRRKRSTGKTIVEILSKVVFSVFGNLQLAGDPSTCHVKDKARI